MADLSGIIRFRKWELDEKRRELAVLFEERNAIEHRIELLDQEMLEQQSMKDSDIGSVTLGAYIEGARKKRAWLLEDMRKKDTDIEAKQEVVSDAFRELKTLEIAERRQQERARQEIARQEQAELDELGLQAYEKRLKE
ncbi:MAG: flagellar FliJ family protein [Kordiimonadaceae bacterium]|nr:flagellar FliJ family protein [Kordiimonadaceae bacterium]MBO6569256.1 flagellar FliJ family protein [Kordiimonadaceae bacterium]MBO6964732.1 flagellar FliJ family protein [Kordiimonadaceae bacterium]